VNIKFLRMYNKDLHCVWYLTGYVLGLLLCTNVLLIKFLRMYNKDLHCVWYLTGYVFGSFLYRSSVKCSIFSRFPLYAYVEVLN